MKKTKAILILLLSLLVCTFWSCLSTQGFAYQKRGISEATKSEVIAELISKYGESQAFRIERGVTRAASLWKSKDGTEEEFKAFCNDNFIADKDEWDKNFRRIEKNFEIIHGYSHRMTRILSQPIRLANQDLLPVDDFFARIPPNIDYFQNKLAFFITLNFPHYSLEEKNSLGKEWSRKDWAKARVGDLFMQRIPSKVQEKLSESSRASRRYFRNYFIHMDRVLTPEHNTIFPQGLRLNTHHGLRDNLKGQYTKTNGLKRQELIYNIMIRIVNQSIPEKIINNPDYYWEPQSNNVFKKEEGQLVPVKFVPENLRRYKIFHQAFQAKKAADPYHTSAPTTIDRTFKSREMQEEQVKELLLSVVDSPLTSEVAEFIEKRLERKLRPFDIWYSGFQAQTQWSENRLDQILKEKYPHPAAFEEDLPNILLRLGFPPLKADFLADHIAVNPVPVGGFSTGAVMRGDKSYIHTRFEKDGLDYKGYRIGMHELGHAVEQTFSLYNADYYFSSGIPMSAFTEAIAELFAYRNIIALGKEKRRDPRQLMERALAAFWYVYEMGGEALLEMKIWRWMYDHPGFTTNQLKEATLSRAKEIWNEYYARNFHEKNSPILAIYNHMIQGSYYLHCYPLGNIIMFQLDSFMQEKKFASQLERMLSLGRLTPDLWMKRAVGGDISTEPLLDVVKRALKSLD